MKSRLPRSSFHHDVVTASGARRSTSRANESTIEYRMRQAARRC
jgi:hypothetical protein